MRFKYDRENEIEYFLPKEWRFWRSLITAFCLGCILGHLLELLYCICINSLFGIIENDYAVWSDPIIHPYWVYGFGAVFMTLFIEPMKEFLLKRTRTLPIAIIKTFLFAILLSVILELLFGLLVNQPDESGMYPYWDNSNLPLNILGQAWIVNDIFIGAIATLYVWVLYPTICECYNMLERKANKVFIIVILSFFVCCLISYSYLIMNGILLN